MLAMEFNICIGIDYSGAAAPETRSKTLQVYTATGGLPERVLVAAPSSTASAYCCRPLRCRPRVHTPRVSTLTYSISSIMTKTKAVIIRAWP
jgi:hypothetical protein